MAKKKSRRSKSKPTPAPRNSGTPSTDALTNRADDQGVPVDDTLVDERKRLDQLSAAYGAAKKRLDNRETELKRREDDLAERKQKFEERLRVFGDEKGDLRAREEELATREAGQLEQEATLLAREEAIAAREADADAGFLARRRENLAALEREHRQLLTALEDCQREFATREAAHAQRLAEELAKFTRETEERREQARDELRAELEASREASAAERATLGEEQANLRAARAQLDARDKEITVRETQLAQEVERRFGIELQEERNRRERADARAEAALRAADELEVRLRELQDEHRELGDESPGARRKRVASMQAEIDRLRALVADSLSADEAAELRALRWKAAAWEDDRHALLDRVAESERHLNQLLVEHGDLDAQRTANRALASQRDLLSQALDELREDIEERLDRGRDGTTFPAMLAMDGDEALQAGATVDAGGQVNLKSLAFDLRHRLARDPAGERPVLYYTERDVRALLGGMSMSRLHLLQGISGIGKSSLARALAQALGGRCDTVSVQAGWRDRDDLFGHYNSFERRYYERPFVQALYRASTPQWTDRIVIVLLDEMNLSHPEQYAADVLDVLERSEPSQRRFALMDQSPDGESPRQLVDGRYIGLPDNVWFVGTANHDETTKDFADKTYDRSFVLELPNSPMPFEVDQVPARLPVACAGLQAAFERAMREHEDAARQCSDWLEQHVKEPLARDFGVGWGGRLKAQIGRFVPVVVAAGGDAGEALDQVLSSRILRKLRGRHDLLEEDLQALRAVIDENWAGPSGPDLSLAILDGELRRF